jgi:GNAT superfamily N-acetyltransferase
LSTDGTASLAADGERAGSRIVRRLVEEWASGANRFDRPGEVLLGAWLDGQLVGVCGLNVDPYAAQERVGRVRHLYVLSALRRLGVGRRLDRLRRTPGELERMIADKTDVELSRRPDAKNWAAKEIVCHLRDVEELFQIRFHTMVALDEPSILVLGASPKELAAWRIGGTIGHPLDPGRWAEERQYLQNDTQEALAAFRRRRAEILALLESLTPAEWQRGGIHLGRGRLTLADWVGSLVAHDDNHVDQLRRALDGRP